MNVTEAVETRRTIRAFQDRAVPLELLREVLNKARWAPSGCNFQPWEAVVLTGEPLRALQEKLLVAKFDEPLEYRFDAPEQSPKYKARVKEIGALMYNSMSIDRSDFDARTDFVRGNVVSFGAPVLLLCHFPKFMGAPQWSDVGMWLQTIMLLLREAGLDSCPQEFMALYGRTIKAELGLAEDEMLFCGLAIGYRDENAVVNNFDRPRVPLEAQVRFRGF